MRASVYWLMNAHSEPQYIGLTRNLRSRLSGKRWPYIGVRYFETRLEAELVEATEIIAHKPPLNGTEYKLCEVWSNLLSGRWPINGRHMLEKEKTPPWTYSEVSGPSGFDRLFAFDELNEPPHLKMMKQ